MIRLYHATSSNLLPKILNGPLNGIRPRNETGVNNWANWDEDGDFCDFLNVSESYPDRVYLGISPERVSGIGEQAIESYGGEIVILEVLVDEKNLICDEDYNHTLKHSWKECLDKFGTCAHIGVIPLDRIKLYDIKKAA